MKGNNKGESARKAGYSESVSRIPKKIEETKEYDVARLYLADELDAQSEEGMTITQELAHELLKNIRQDSDKGAKIRSIQFAMEKIEPTESKKDDSERVIVVLHENVPPKEVKNKIIDQE